MTEIMFDELFNSYKPVQDINEMKPFFFDILVPRKIKEILEIGTEFGGSSIIWNQLCQENEGYFIGVDLAPERAQKMLFDSTTPVSVVKGDSRSSDTVDAVKKLMRPNKFDFLFIDADHCFPAVMDDIKNYFPLLQKGGIIAFHDANIGGDVDMAIKQSITTNVLTFNKSGMYAGRMGLAWFEKA